ncbi:ComEA family DNA-binding protein [Acinetobacter sp. ANC 4216]|uniref:ComEA family DNA-binding protein n=1 Tax=Acinetobacter sp. ANC 4216 TaxID=2529840 RepID=UPI00103DEFCA|nr:ComEA family DNA-binding protein [Acinetobacter sp. ANC 4216]TCB70347.1 ComEA family DNA-binding protein [Acinetobacter sp. ANC 4216]
MKKIISTLKGFFYLFGLMSLLSVSSSYAQQFDQEYLKWKAEQEAQDARLKIPRVSTRDYYLSRPALNSATSTASKINLNQANAEQLQALSGVGQKKAEAIIAYRQKNGKFKNIEELQQVKGIGPALFSKNKDRLGL